MGLQSALTTALTGLQAAEAVIDVSGNNLANSNTVGFKSSTAQFATQFLRTQSLGSTPTSGSGGTNPRQVGLGTQVAEITPDFSQGTIEVSSSPSDLAIQGDGFFVVQGASGETLYSRNGILKLNSANELVTISGNRLMGFGVSGDFVVEETTLVPLTIPLGNTQVAQATQNVFMEGTLIPNGDLATQAAVIQSAVLGSTEFAIPTTKTTAAVAARPIVTASTAVSNTDGSGGLTPGATYLYKYTYVDASGKETLPSATTIPATAVTVAGGDDSIVLTGFPADPSSGTKYTSINVYRTTVAAPTVYQLVTTQLTGAGPYTDNTADGALGATLDESTITGNYSYYATYYNSTNGNESRPSLISDQVNVTAGRVHLTGLPPDPTDGRYDSVRIYRNLATDSSKFFLAGSAAYGADFTDAASDTTIAAAAALDLDGDKISSTTLLTNINKQSGSSNSLSLSFEPMFVAGKLTFQGKKGGRDLESKDFTVSATSTVADLLTFMNEAMGIQGATADALNNIPGSTDAANPLATLSAGASITPSGQFRFVGNNGVDNAVDVTNSAFTLIADSDGSLTTPQMNFVTSQTAIGESAVTDFIAYDSLGIPMNVRVTTVLEKTSGTEVTYRWFADSADNDISSSSAIAVGTGQIVFDSQGNMKNVTQSSVSVARQTVSSISPATFNLDFSSLSGLSGDSSSLVAAGTDGSGAGSLTSFIIGEDGRIRGVFSNGVTRDLGQIRLARFANPNGLEQRGQNLFASSVNSGLAIEGDPGEQGIGSVRAGAVELSNTDVGQSLIDLILASTQYRSNTRVINSAQQLLDELLNLRR